MKKIESEYEQYIQDSMSHLEKQSLETIDEILSWKSSYSILSEKIKNPLRGIDEKRDEEIMKNRENDVFRENLDSLFAWFF